MEDRALWMEGPGLGVLFQTVYVKANKCVFIQMLSPSHDSLTSMVIYISCCLVYTVLNVKHG